MPSNRLPRRILYGELVNGQRLPGGPKLRYMDHIRRILHKCNISTVELEQLSTDRDTWKSACASGLATYNVAADQAAEDRRTRRHNPPKRCTYTEIVDKGLHLTITLYIIISIFYYCCVRWL